MKTSPFLSIICFFIIISVTAQEGARFKENKKIFLHGNSVLIGNNILGHHPTNPLMNTKISNDEVNMKYIDVDGDTSTFSSSQADISNLKNGARIAHAELYWYGLYPYKTSALRESRNKLVHVGKGQRDTIVNSIKFKTPEGNYEDVVGEVVFDSYSSNLFIENSPYVCYADITKKIQNLSSRNGTYTVANIKATTGKILGGGSAGWLLYIVYEDENESPKYFTTYNGLSEVSNNAVTINFKNFKSKEEGDFKTTIALAAMEGDRNIKSDQVSIFNKKKRRFEALSTPMRDKKNFFNSSITLGSENSSKRNPASTNTLGFDLLKMEIPNPKNNLLNNSTTEVKLQFETKKDRYYMFFAAFETEINKEYLEEKTREAQDDNSTIAFTPKTFSANSEAASLNNKAEKEVESEPLELSEEELLLRTLNIESVNIPGLVSGYYLITNVFAELDNAKSWSKYLAEKGYTPKTYINPANNWYYIYIANNKSILPIYDKWQKTKDLEYFNKIWILKINL